MSVFLVKHGLIAIGAEQDVRHPVRRSSHLRTDDIQINAGAAFDDQFIMDMTDDKAVSESFYGIAEYIAADGLNDILHELRTVGFDAFPFLRGSDTFIGDRFAAELILTDAGLHVGEPATGRELDEEHTALVEELDSAYFSLDPLFDGNFDCVVNIPPELCDHRVG